MLQQMSEATLTLLLTMLALGAVIRFMPATGRGRRGKKARSRAVWFGIALGLVSSLALTAVNVEAPKLINRQTVGLITLPIAIALALVFLALVAVRSRRMRSLLPGDADDEARAASSMETALPGDVLVRIVGALFIAVSLFRAVQKALSNVIGAYAIAVIDKNEPHCLVATRKSSPLAIGVGDDNQEFFLASDPTPMIEYTRDIIFVEDGDVVELIPGKAPYMETLSNQVIEPKISNVTMDLGMSEKEGYPHFMIKEILDQPRVLGDCMRGRVSADLKEVILSAMVDHRDRLLSAERIIIVGCGTSWHAALIGKQLIESLARIPVEVEYSSEFRYRNPIIRPSDVVIAMSQSGETADTLAAIQLAKEKGAFIYGICNSVGSSIARATDSGTYIHVGPEIGVASTKAFTGQVTVLVLLALCLGREKGSLAPEHYTQIIDDLLVLPEKIEKIFEQKERIEQLSTRFTYAHNFIYLGRGINYPVALEGALKLKEISYIHAEGYPAAEMKHGPIALIDEEMPIVVIATRDKIYEKVVSNIQEIKARKGRIIAIVNEGDTQVANMVDYVIEIPEIAPELEPLLTVVPLQLLSYYIAVCKGKDVDQPRNLAKSVTVE